MAPPQAHHAFLLSMVETGEFSDFTLVCGGHEFKLHQVVVCPQSSVIATVLSGGFQENTSKIINVNDFDISTVRYMISFLYTGEYQPEKKSRYCFTRVIQDDENGPMQRFPNMELLTNENTENILSHLRVNTIADYYNVESLAELAVSKIKDILKQGQRADLFPRVIQEMSKANIGEGLCAIVASAAAECMGDLIKLKDFRDIELEHNLVVGMLRALATKIRDLQAQLQASQRSAAGESDRNVLFRESVDCSLAQLEKTKTCRNCPKVFGCFFEKLGPDSKVPYVLRCRSCHYGHP